MLKNHCSTSFELGDSASKEVVKEAYTGMQPALEQAEKQYEEDSDDLWFSFFGKDEEEIKK